MNYANATVRSVMTRGNGAYIVHSELANALPTYQLRGCNPYLATIPGLPLPDLRRWLSDVPIVHLPADYGHVPLLRDSLRVITFHNFYLDPANIARSSFAQRLFYRHVLQRSVISATNSAHRIVVVSRFLADRIRQHGLVANTPVEIIYNGIDTQRFCPAENVDHDRPLRVLFVGNPSRRKGFHFLAALADYLPNGVELAFTTGLRDEQTKAIHPRLISLGRVPYSEMHRLYQQSDILLFPTYLEGFGLCVAEAMACGLPVVSTNCSSIPELIDENRGGFLVEPGDFASMLERTLQLLADADLRSEMGQWNRARAIRDFDRPRMIRDYRELFESLI
jgi:glycosyltransferase involved in cell wall biosynthesis